MPNAPVISAPVRNALSFTLPVSNSAETHSAEKVLLGRPAVTLQTMVLSLQGVCTEPGVFYNLTGKGWVSESSGTVFLAPEATLKTDTFGNMIGIGNLDRACRLDGLYLAITGTGQVEIKVFQVATGRSWERLTSDVLDLSPTAETVVDLSHYALNTVSGGIWFELTNCSEDSIATVTGARYLTAGKVGAGMRLAICMADTETTVSQEVMSREHLEKWCAGAGKAAGAQVLHAAAGTAELAQLQDAKSQGYSHAIVLDPTTLIASETLNRIQAYLSLARSPDYALGAAVLDPGEKWFIASNGVLPDQDDKPAAKFQGVDLRDRLQVVSMESELAEEAELCLGVPARIRRPVAAQFARYAGRQG